MTESGMKLILWVVAASLMGAMLAIPQPVDPWEMPSLVLERSAVAETLRRDTLLAAAVSDAEEAQTLQSLFLAHGRAEADPPYERVEYDQRQAEIHFAVEAVVTKLGPEALEAMRAHAVNEFIRVFGDGSGDFADEYEVGVVGVFREMLVKYGAIHQDVVIAPEMTVRALYKARWNSIHRRPFVEGFSRIERQAYWGWLALHGWGAELADRKEALLAFRDAGGSGAEEAAALFDLLEQRPDRAAKLLERLYLERGELRLRNLSLGALHASLLPAASP